MSDLDPAELAGRIVMLVGGPANIAEVTRCWSRLRLVLVDDTAADEAGLGRQPEVRMVVRQGGQLQLVLAGELEAVFGAVVAQAGAARG